MNIKTFSDGLRTIEDFISLEPSLETSGSNDQVRVD